MLQVVAEVLVFGHVRVEQTGEEVDLAVRHEHSQLGRDEPLAAGLAFVDHLVGGKGFDFPVQTAGVFQVVDQPMVDVDHRGCLRNGQAQCLGLGVAPIPDLLGHRVGHCDQ